jgi:hypothetical protein
MYKAFEGANGWYVAFERRDGTHKQPSLGPWLSEREARAEARERNAALAAEEREGES